MNHVGGGGGGKVALIANRNTLKMSALKRVKIVPHLSISRQPGRNELDLLHLAQGSPHTVKLRGGTYNMNNFFIETEFMSGGSLANRLTVHLIQIDEIQNISYQVLRGLRYLHQNNIIHRDVKPDNILLQNERGFVWAKICVFSVATRSREPMDEVGTPG